VATPWRNSRSTQHDLARKLGLDQSTISRALREDPRISVRRRQEIREAAASIGYVPNPLASGLVSYRKNSRVRAVGAELAWINFRPDSKQKRSWKEFDFYWRGAVGMAEALGYRLEEFSVGGKMTSSRLQKILLARSIEGIVIAPQGDLQFDWQEFDWNRFSVVRLGRNSTSPVTHVVAPDQAANAMLAFFEMRARGYRRIGFVGDPNPNKFFGAGFLWAQSMVPSSEQTRPYGLAPRMPFEPDGFRIWLNKESPDAILMEDPRIPAGLKAAGWRVPEDVGLAGTTLLDTTASAGIDQNPMETGRAAISVVASLLQERALGLPVIPRTTLIKGNWVDGPSLQRKNERPASVR